MSFNTDIKKPKLVENKLIKYYNDKNRQKELKLKIEQEDILKKQLEEQANNIPPEPIYKKVLNPLWEFIKENYGFFIIVTLISILLYVRYIEVSRKKERMKNVIDQINKQNEIEEIENEVTLDTTNF
jgi:hypothetical protein